MDAWLKVWRDRAKQEEHPLWKMTSGDSLGDLETQLMRRVCGAFKWRTGLGLCNWHPRHWSWLSEEALECLKEILLACERLRHWPEGAWGLMIFLIEKAEGGGSRPICLLPSITRVWEAVRDEVTAAMTPAAVQAAAVPAADEPPVPAAG